MAKCKSLVVIVCIIFSTLAKAQFNYGHQMEFGKNRIQYQNFVWTYFDYERYRVYNYQGGIEIAKYVALVVNKELPIIEKRLDYVLEDKVNIIVYNNQNDFKQSNIGLQSGDMSNIGGMTKIVGDKIFVFFNGSHAELDQQIRAALAKLAINQALFGGSLRDMVRSSTLLNLPEWYTTGLEKYLSEGWNSYSDNYLYDAVKNDLFLQLNKLTGKQATNAGHAIWYYIVDTYGESVIPNLLYMTKVSRSPDNAFLFVLGVTQDNLVYDFTDAYNRRLFANKDSLRVSPINNNSVLKKYKKQRHYFQLKVSPDGKQVAYSQNYLNQLKVYVKDLETGKTQRLLKLNPKLEQLDDNNYPLLAWHPKGNILAMIYEKKDQLVIHTKDFESKEVVKRNLPGFEKVNSFSFSGDGKKLALSAVKKSKGQADIFVFGLNTSAVDQITNDIWDDNNPVFVRGNKQIVFESNRENDTIKTKDDANYFVKIKRNMDLFMCNYPLTSKALVRVTNTPNVNETQAQTYNRNYVTYLSDENGIYNQYVAEFDSTISFVDTTEHYRYFFKSKCVSNYDRNILEQNINFNSTHVADVVYANGKDMLLVTPLNKLIEQKNVNTKPTWFRGNARPIVSDPSNFNLVPSTNNETQSLEKDSENKGIDFDNYKLEGEKPTTVNTPTINNNKASKDTTRIKNIKKTSEFKFPIQKNYYTSFYSDYVVTQLDNSFMANNYQLFTNPGAPLYLNPGVNFLTKVAISDLFEDQRIVGGFRINPTLDNEFMLMYENRKKQFDHQFIFDRQTFARVADDQFATSGYFNKINTHTGSYSIKYPFNPVSAVRLSVLYRNDRKVALSNSDFTLPQKNTFSNLAALRGEYIFDNTRFVTLNIFNGFRAKVWGEYWQFLETENNRNMITFGFDARHYQKVHRQITWCNRFAGGNSLGTDKLIFYLGGVDNWLNPSFNQAINVVRPTEYGFQTIATNMRGFQQNIRNGNNFLVYNSELRFPLVKYFFNRSFRSDFLNNFQLVAFGDLGMAWYGINPLSKENTENSNSYLQEGNNVIITVTNPKDPLVAGFGWGMRSRLFGYFVRLDFGWGVDKLEVQNKAIINFSLATDF